MKQFFTQNASKNAVWRGIQFLALSVFLNFAYTSASAQCNNNSQWGSATAPTSGTVNISTCNYQSEYSPINSVAAATTYTCTYVGGGYVTIRQGTPGGTVIAHGPSPLQWSSTTAGTYYAHWNVNASCATAFNCGTTTITYVGPANACTNPVVAGTVDAPAAACANQSVTLSLTGASLGSGITYNWFSSANATGPFTSQGTNASLAATLTAPTYYFCEVICSGGTAAYTDTVLVDIEPFYNCYCNSTATSTGDSKINAVELAGSVFSTGNTVCETYTNNTATPIDVIATVPNTLRIQNGSCSGNHYGAYMKAWVDINQNGVYEASEVVADHGQTSTLYVDWFSTVTIPSTAPTGLTGMRVRLQETFTNITNPCGNFSWGEVEDYLINVIPAPTNDVGISELSSPAFPACEIDSNICVVLQNNGLDTLFSADLQFSVNGGTFSTPTSWTGVILPGQTDTVCTTVGTYNFAIGDSLTVVANNPNNATGTLLSNDTFNIGSMNVSLQGTYSIPGDYTTFNDAVDAMIDLGICDDVVFEVASGTYTEQISIPSISGSGPDATVTFTSAAGDSSLAILTNVAATTAEDNYVVKFDGADYFTFDQLTIESVGTSYGVAVRFDNSSNNNTLSNNHLIAPSTTSTSSEMNVVYSSSSVDNNNTIINNLIENGAHGVWMAGSNTTTPETGLLLENNMFLNNYRGGAIILYNSNVVAMHNTVTSNSTNTGSSWGLDFEYCDFAKVAYNHVYSDSNTWPFIGISGYYSTGTLSQPIEFYNNVVTIGHPSNQGNGLNRGMYSVELASAYVVHNTITLRGGSNQARALELNNPSGIIAENNILSNFAEGYTLFTSGSVLADLNYNNYYTDSTGAGINYSGTNFSTVADFNAAFPNQEVNGFNLNPEFIDTVAGSLCNDLLDGQATPYAWITDDQNGAVRSTNPDPGAVEFFAPENFVFTGDTLCGTEYLVSLNGPVNNPVWDVNGAISNGQTVLLTTGSTPTDFTIDLDFSALCSVDTAGNSVPVSVSADFRLIPDVELDSSLHLCADETATLNPGGGSNASYLWYPTNETSSTIEIDGGGIYSVNKEEEGCVSDATIIVTQSDGVDLLDAEVCADDLPYTANATIVGGTSYVWSDGTTTTANIDLSATGVYYVTATDDQGCTSIDSINFEAIDVPTADFDETHTGLVYYFNSSASINAGSSASYQWDFGDGSPISTDPNPTHQFPWSSPSTPQVYVVSLTIVNDCGSNSTNQSIDVTPTGIYNISSDVSYKVYPNPSNGVVNIEFNGTVADQASLKVLDITGRVVSTSNANTNDIHTLDMSGVASGTYILEVSVDGATSQSRISIQ